MAVEAKAKLRMRHEEAIRRYRCWLKAHPRAKQEKRIEVFDNYIDDPNYKPRRKRFEHLSRT
jgi:hypothetical protein